MNLIILKIYHSLITLDLYSMKKITVNIPAYIQSVVELENRVQWANSPDVTIPSMKYPQSSLKPNSAPLHAFLSSIMP